MNSKNIVIIGPIPPLRGGIAHFTDSLAGAFQKQHSVKVFSFKRLYPSFLYPGKFQKENLKPQNDYPVFPVIDILNPLSWLKAAAVIKKIKTDLIIISYHHPFSALCLGTIGQLINKKTDQPVLALIHNVLPHEPFLFSGILLKFFLTGCSGCIVLSKNEGNRLKTITTKPVLMVKHPVYDRFGQKTDKTSAKNKLKLDPAKKYLLFFGFIRPYKRLDAVLKALSEFKDYNLLIAGECFAGKHRYRKMIRDLNLAEKTAWHDRYIPDREVKYYFSAADFLVWPYRHSPQSGVLATAENFGLPVLKLPRQNNRLPVTTGNKNKSVLSWRDLAQKIISFASLI